MVLGGGEWWDRAEHVKEQGEYWIAQQRNDFIVSPSVSFWQFYELIGSLSVFNSNIK